MPSCHAKLHIYTLGSPKWLAFIWGIATPRYTVSFITHKLRGAQKNQLRSKWKGLSSKTLNNIIYLWSAPFPISADFHVIQNLFKILWFRSSAIICLIWLISCIWYPTFVARPIYYNKFILFGLTGLAE